MGASREPLCGTLHLPHLCVERLTGDKVGDEKPCSSTSVEGICATWLSSADEITFEKNNPKHTKSMPPKRPYSMHTCFILLDFISMRINNRLFPFLFSPAKIQLFIHLAKKIIEKR
jgi:hypothetical protein